ncbi:MAG TPA: endonuclease MutS2 [Clostridiales bacterium]|nr:endonuclease MutS2 [Clostridiales bacterium]
MEERTLRILEFVKIKEKLISLCSSELGKELAAALLPQTQPEEVERMLKETTDAVDFILRRGSPPLGGIHDIRDTLRRVELGTAINPGELLRVADTLRAARNLKNYASEADPRADESGNHVRDLIASVTPNKRIEDSINAAIISDEEISDNASSTLASIRKRIREEQESLKDKLNSMIHSSKYQKFMQESIVTIREDRYVIPVKAEYRNEIPGLVHDSSASGATVYIEPMAMVEANNNIKQLRIKEQLEIERILQELTGEVAGIIEPLKANMTLFAQLDFVFAKAKLSLDLKCVCPKLNREKRINIKKGRHPLLDSKTVVPIDLWIGERFTTLVITGPNTGGKTVTLKTVGLFTLMVQSGLHVPAAEGTEMSVFDNVFADIGDEQSIEQSLSTFSSHMRNIVEILSRADDMSLVLFDELGAGTDPTEGAALAMSILENLHGRGAITIATTHYSELKVYALTTDGVENACCEFDVETLRPTYRLLIGVPGKSNAFAISKRLGLSDDILDRAREFLSGEEIQFEDVLMTIERNRRESEQERLQAESLRLEIEKLKKELEEQKYKLSSQREKLLREAREEARRILLDARKDAGDILEEMKQATKLQDEKERRRAAEEAKAKLRGSIGKIEESLAEGLFRRKGFVKPPENLKPGDSVLILDLNQKGTVITPPDKDGEALVQAGIMKINVHVTNLKLIDEQSYEIQRTGSSSIGVSKAMNISPRTDIRGMNVEEAIIILGKYLDDAALAGLSEVTIVHGKGTGALRSGVHQYLKTNHHVKSFRLGQYGEGEAGVTIVTLK